MTRDRAGVDWRLLVAAAAGVAVLISLGVWQLQRRAWKADLLADLTARQAQEPLDITAGAPPATGGSGAALWAADNLDRARFTPVTLRGRYDHARQVGVPTTKDGVAGWRIVTPLQVARAAAAPRAVFVDRGFVARTPQTVEAPPSLAGEAAVVTVTGLVRPQAGDSWFTPGPDGARRVSYSLDPAQLAQAAWPDDGADAPVIAGFTVAAIAEDPAPAGATLTANPPRVADIANRHLEYALTWFALAASLAGVAAARFVTRDRGGSRS